MGWEQSDQGKAVLTAGYAWEDAHGEEADLSKGWDDPLDSVTDEPHSADPELFGVLRLAERPPLLMPWKDLLQENEG